MLENAYPSDNPKLLIIYKDASLETCCFSRFCHLWIAAKSLDPLLDTAAGFADPRGWENKWCEDANDT